MARPKPAYARRKDDPIACSALRSQREARSSWDAKFTERTIKELRVCSPLVVEAVGADVMRKYLWRSMRSTPAGDLIEAAGLRDRCPATDRYLTMFEIIGRKYVHPWQTTGIFIANRLGDPQRDPRSCADASLLDSLDEAGKLRLQAVLRGAFQQPCVDAADACPSLVSVIAHAVAWGATETTGHVADAVACLTKCARFCAVLDITDDIVWTSIRERWLDLRAHFKAGRLKRGASTDQIDFTLSLPRPGQQVQLFKGDPP